MRELRGIGGLWVLIANTLGNVETNLLQPMRELYGGGYVSPMYRRAGVNYANIFGQAFICVGANDARAVNRLRGKKIGYVAGDEVPTWPHEVLQMLKTRLDDPRATADLTGNPEGPAHPFKRDLIDRAGELDVYYSHYTLDDNPFLDRALVAQLKRELTGVWYKRLILGLWVAAEGAVYDMLDTDRHVIANDALPAMRWHIVGTDYGTASVTTMRLWGLGVDNVLYCVDSWRHDAAREYRQLTDGDVCQAAESWLSAWKVQPRMFLIPSDAASLIAEATRRRAKNPLGPFRNLAVADRAPDSVLDGIRTYAGLLATDRVRYARRVFDKGGLDELLGYSWDPKAQKRGEDKPLKQNDHDCDADRYSIFSARGLWQPLVR